MKEIRFLCDECIDPDLMAALWQRQPEIDIIHVGDPGAPPKGTKDPELLLWVEAEKRCLISQDKRTMPQHLADHFAAGHHTWGVLFLRKGFAMHRYVDDLVLIWSTMTVAECSDYTDYLPW